MKTPFFVVLSMVVCLPFLSCGKEEPWNGKEPSFPENPQPSVSEPFSPRWVSLVDNSVDEQSIDISTRYLGIQGTTCVASPPPVYVGAVFPENSFAAAFDREVTHLKNPVGLTFDFPNPYLTSMDDVRESGYWKKIKEVLRSEEYKSYTFPKSPYQVQFAELDSLSHVEACFPDNKRFGHEFEKVGRQWLKMKGVKSLLLGRIVFKGFTVSMDVPAKGLFVDEALQSDEWVYVRTLTYGATAYCLIASEYSFSDTMEALKTSFVLDKDRPEEVLSRSQIVLLTVSDISQEAGVCTTFEDLNRFINNPLGDGVAYGYPIFCKGFYTKDNRAFIK